MKYWLRLLERGEASIRGHPVRKKGGGGKIG
jgi:hypothetical protein